MNKKNKKMTKEEAIKAIEMLPLLEEKFNKKVEQIKNKDKDFISPMIIKYIESVEKLMHQGRESAEIALEYLKYTKDEDEEDQQIFASICEGAAEYAMVITMLDHLYNTANFNEGGESISSTIQ